MLLPTGDRMRTNLHGTTISPPMPVSPPPLTPVLREAALTHRVTCGVMDCASLLRCNHDNVMLCVLPEVSGQPDVTLNIQHTLIEAFCCENNITVIKVRRTHKLCAMLCPDDELPEDTVFDDMSCILIEYPPAASPTTETSVCRERRHSLYSTHMEVPP